MGSRALWFVAGAGVGVVLMLRLRRATETSCCARVAVGARERAGTACGVAGSLCQRIGDGIGIWGHVPDILDAFGVKP